jgi:hypothetical protein
MFNPWKNALTSQGFSLLYIFLDLWKSFEFFWPSGGECLTSSPEVRCSNPGCDTFPVIPLTLIPFVHCLVILFVHCLEAQLGSGFGSIINDVSKDNDLFDWMTSE